MQNLITQYNRFTNAAFDAFMASLEILGRPAEVLGVAALLGVVVSLIFTLRVDKERLRRARNDLRATLLEIWLYRHDPKLVLQAQKQLLLANLSYTRAFFPPFVLAILIVSPVLVQSHYRFALKPIPGGSQILLTAVLDQSPIAFEKMDLEWISGNGTISTSVRQPALHRVVWRLQPEGAGIYTLRLKGATKEVEFPLYVGGFKGSIATSRAPGSIQHLVMPRGTPLKENSGFERIYVDYPGAEPGWLLWLTAGSLVAAFATNRVVSRYA